MATAESDYKYWAFLSYSHGDEKWAARLHRGLETYRGHKRLAKSLNVHGERIPERLFPVFRDRDELEGVPDLPVRIHKALTESRYLVVVCSRRAAASRWVNEEIRIFKTFEPRRDVLAFIVDGEPGSADERECFPEALRFRVGPDGRLTTDPEEPGAADARKSKDGYRNALLKIIAKLLGVQFDVLRRRDQQRRRRLVFAGMSVLTVALLIFAGLASFAWKQWGQAEIAQQAAESNAAEAKKNAEEAKRNAAQAESNAAEAERQRLDAEKRARIALSRELAALARNELPESGDNFDLSRALLLAVQAVRTEPLIEGYAILLRALQATPRRMRFLWGHRGVVEDVAFTRDGRVMVSAGQDGRAILWDTVRGQRLGELAVGVPLYSAALEPGTGVVALAGVGGEVTFWDLTTRKRVGDHLKTGDKIVSGLAFSPDGRTLATAGSEGSAKLWDVASRKIESSLKGLRGALVDVAFSPDGRTLATAGDYGQLMLWDRTSGEPTSKRLNGHEPSDRGSASAVAFSADGKSLVSAGSHSIVLQWDLTREPLDATQLRGHAGAVLAAAFAPNTASFATAGKDGLIRLWNPDVDAPLRGHGDEVNGVGFSPDGKLLASAGGSGRLILWDTMNRPPLGEPLEGNREWVNDVVLSPAGNIVVALGPEMIIWDTARRRIVMGPRDGSVKSAAFSPESKYLAAVNASGELFLVDLRNAQPTAEQVGQRGPDILAVGFSAGGRQLITIDITGTVRSWDVASRRQSFSQELRDKSKMNFFSSTLSTAAFSADGAKLAWSMGGRIALWDVARRKPVSDQVKGHESAVLQMAFGPTGKTLISIDQRSNIGLWDVHTTPLRSASISPPPGISFLRFANSWAFSPDGRTLATAVEDGFARSQVVLWDVATRNPVSEPMPAGKAVHSLEFSPDGSVLAAGSEQRVYLWDVASRRSVGELRWGHERAVTGLAFSSDGNQLLSAGGRVILWNLDRRHWLQEACRVANRNLSRQEWADVMDKETPYERICPGLPQPSISSSH